MKLKKITISGLFNTFKHVITFNENDGITIVIGENGLGKTIILEMIESLFNKRFDYFSHIDFEIIELEFTDGIKWNISLDKSEPSDNTPPHIYRRRPYYPLTLIETSPKRKTTKKTTLQAPNPEAIQRTGRIMRGHLPFLDRIGPDTWIDQRTGEIIDSEMIRLLYSSRLYGYLEDGNDIPDWVTNRMEVNKVYLIKTQRLLLLEEREKKSITKTVDKFSAELSRMIQFHLAQSTALSSELDRTYPNRLLKRLKKRNQKITSSNLHNSLDKLTQKRALLSKVGLIDFQKDYEITIDDSSSSEEVRNVLQLYVEDSFEKLKIYDELSQKLEIFLNIINKRFKHKSLIIDKDQGFIFKSTVHENSTISAGNLSSGEQNELVLFYELLFKTKENTLVLIDEPEISLHISWQNCFIDDLKEIIRLNKFDILIATHSPNIIGNNWDLKVELKGLE